MTTDSKRYIYLAGKIKVGHGATEYRAKVAPILLEHGIYSLDPLRGKYAMADWSALSPTEVVVRDLQDIQRSHIVLAVMMKYEDTSFGTPCEIMYAWQRDIPIILITDERYLADHFWTKGLCSKIFFVDKENGQTFDKILLQVAEHIGHWYGREVEEEVYQNPQLTRNRSDNKLNVCECCDCDDALDESCSQCRPLGEETDINPDEEAARADGSSI